MQWALDLVLIVLLAATLFHALRLERALGVLKRDRAALEDLVAGFNTGMQQAEQGAARLREAADGAGRQIARQLEAAQGLRDDLRFLIERGGTLADRLDNSVRAARLRVAERPPPPPAPSPSPEPEPRVRSQAERDLLRALRGTQ